MQTPFIYFDFSDNTRKSFLPTSGQLAFLE